MAHILLPPGYATDQSGATFGIVSHTVLTYSATHHTFCSVYLVILPST